MARIGALIDAVAAWIGMAVLVALLSVVTLGIVTRALGNPFSWTDEMSGFLMVWLSCFGWIIATRRGAHIRIRFFQDKLPRQIWRGTEMAIQLALALFGAVVAVGGAHLAHVNHDIEAISIPVSTAWMYVPLIPAGAVAFIQGLVDFWRRLKLKSDTEGQAA